MTWICNRNCNSPKPIISKCLELLRKLGAIFKYPRAGLYVYFTFLLRGIISEDSLHKHLKIIFKIVTKKLHNTEISIKNLKLFTFSFRDYLPLQMYSVFFQKCCIILIYSVRLLTSLLIANHENPSQPSDHPTGI